MNDLQKQAAVVLASIIVAAGFTAAYSVDFLDAVWIGVLSGVFFGVIYSFWSA